MKKWIIFGLICFISFQDSTFQPLVAKETSRLEGGGIKAIDQKIEQLIDLKNKELGKAAWAQNQGDRLQFQSSNLIDARRFWREAQTSRQIASKYQKEIDKLECLKQKMIKNSKSKL